MVKRKDKKSATSNQPSEKIANDQAKKGYTIGQWAGHEQFRCRECEYDTLDLDVMLEHLLMVHSVVALKEPEPFPPSPPASLPQGEGSERVDGIFEIDLKEDQDHG